MIEVPFYFPLKATSLHLPAELRSAMQAHVQQISPLEACGLIGGLIDGDEFHALAIFPVANKLYSPTRYRMDAREQLAAFDAIDAQGWQLVGIYHSHPAGPEQPSPTDIAEAFYPEAVYLIWSKAGEQWDCRAFMIQNKSVEEVEMQFASNFIQQCGG